MLTDALRNGVHLSDTAVEEAARALLDPEVPDAAKAEFLIALRGKGETSAEIAAFVHALLRRAVDPMIDPAELPGPMLDVCGTGGDRMDLFNVSTTSMFVLAAGGAAVVKHGNRGVTSKCGGADVLETLGVRIDLPPAELRRCVREHGVGFMFALQYHPAFKTIAPVRRMLAAQGKTTVFNLLGPLLNPARPPYQLIGVFSETLLGTFSSVLALLGRESAWVVNGQAPSGLGVDELSTMGATCIHEVRSGKSVAVRTIAPSDLGLKTARIEDLTGGDCAANARILEGVLAGTIRGPKRDVVLLNAAAGFTLTGLAPDLASGISLAGEQIDSGRALAKLDALRTFQPSS